MQHFKQQYLVSWLKSCSCFYFLLNYILYFQENLLCVKLEKICLPQSNQILSVCESTFKHNIGSY